MKKSVWVLMAFFLFNAPAYADSPAEKQVTLQVNEMTCQLCAYLVNKELRDIDGVISTKANIKDHSVNVVSESKVSEQQLIDAIHKLQYTATVIQ